MWLLVGLLSVIVGITIGLEIAGKFDDNDEEDEDDGV